MDQDRKELEMNKWPLFKQEGWNQLGSAIVDDNNNKPHPIAIGERKNWWSILPTNALHPLFAFPLPFIILLCKAN
jgi:hypothetical protein